MEAGNRFLKVMSAMVIAAVVAMGQVDITDKFTDPNFKAKVYKAINKTAPAPIYDSDVDTVKSLILANSRISSFAGIEYFTGLTTLDCDYNRLTTLDVSKNTALTELYCSSNQLTTLDVSKNTALTALDCSSNQLTTLDVSKNTELGWLDCSNNQLTTLDLSKNTELGWLDCSNNQLTTLDLSKNTELIYLDCSNNQLTTLDLSKMNTKSWWYLDVRANYLENESKILGLNELSMDVFYFHPQKTNNTNTVTFNSLGGSPVDQVTGVLGFSRINEPDEPTRDDYMFVGWYTDTEWKNLWNFTSNIVTQDTILYAKWHYTLGEDIEIFADTTTYIYDGGEQRIGTVRLYLKGEKKILEEGVGFTVDKYENNIDAGRNAIAMITLIDEYEHSGITKKPIQFEIQKCTVSVSWENTTFTYNGERQVPTPTSGNPKFPAKVIKTDYESINAGSNRVYAGLVEPNNNIILSGEQQAYTINPKEIRVIWGEEREFVYNKMIQHPAWSLESDEIDRNHVYIAPTYSVVGEYTEVNGLAPVVQIVPEHNSNIYHNNYTLVNTRVDYKILPKSLTARLKGTVNNKLSLSYKYETEAELEEHLSGMVEYVGFASDSTGTDSENDLRENKPKVKLHESESGNSQRSLRGTTASVSEIIRQYEVEIKTDEVKADNYTARGQEGTTLSVSSYILSGMATLSSTAVKVSDVISAYLDIGEADTKRAGGLIYEWYVGDEKVANTVSYTIKASDVGKDIRAEISGTNTVGKAISEIIRAAGGANPILDIKNPDKRGGIRLSNNIASDKAVITIDLPNNERVSHIKVVVYDNTGNSVFETTERNAKVEWHLTNAAGRNVANGTYLIIAEARGNSGKTYKYSAKLGVRR